MYYSWINTLKALLLSYFVLFIINFYSVFKILVFLCALDHEAMFKRKGRGCYGLAKIKPKLPVLIIDSKILKCQIN